MTVIAEAAPQNVTLAERVTMLQMVNEWAQEEAAANEGELPEWLEELQSLAEADVRAKAERVGLRVTRLRAMIGECKAEEQRIAARRASFQRQDERLVKYLDAMLREAGMQKIETPLVTVRIQKNGGAAAIRWAGDGDVPESWRKEQPIEPNLQAVRDHLRMTGVLPAGFIELPRGESVRVQ